MKRMLNKRSALFLALFLVAGMGPVYADMVILKSGEMFQTRKAWKENGVVKYYRNGQVVRVDERDVERLIHIRAPVESPPVPEERTTAEPPMLPSGETTGRLPSPQMQAGDDTGYLGLKWGLSPSQIEGLVLVETDPAYGGVQLYTKEKRTDRFGRASVNDIVYGFWQGGLYTLTVWTGNFLDFRDLKAEAFRRFGKGVQRRPDVEKYHWMDKGADRMLAYDFDTEMGFLWMRSQVLHEKVKAIYPE